MATTTLGSRRRTWLGWIYRACAGRYESGWSFALMGAALFALVQVFGHLQHEMWRDELQCWSMGRASHGLWDLLTGERRYEGHPFLWYYVLHLVSRLSGSFATLHFVTGALVVAAAGLWLRYAPLPRILRVLLLGSYYLVYEYGVISRTYTLGLFLTFAFCALYHPRRIRHISSAVLLSLLAATSMYGMLMSVALGVFLFSHGPSLRRPDDTDARTRVVFPVEWMIGLGLYLVGLALTVITTIPPADDIYQPGPAVEITGTVLRDAAARYWQVMFPFHALTSWNWLFADWLGSGWSFGPRLMPWLGALWFGVWIVVLRRSLRVVVTYGLGIAAMVLAEHIVYPGGLRHLGNCFILLLACVWLHARETRGRFPDRVLHALLAANLVLQCLTGFAALRTDSREVFSGAEEAATFIREHHLLGLPVVGDPDAPTSAVASALDRPFFYPETGETAEAIVWHNRRSSVSREQVLEHARRLARSADGMALIVLNYDLPPGPTPGLTSTLVFHGKPAILVDESFRIYQVKLAD